MALEGPLKWALLIFTGLCSINFVRALNLPQVLHEVAYFSTRHPPAAFALPLVFHTWLGHVWHAVLALTILGAAWGLGRTAGRWIQGGKGASSSWLTALGFGLGGLGVLGLGLGLCGLLFPGVVIAVIFVGLTQLRGLRTSRLRRRSGAFLRDIAQAGWETRWLLVFLGVMGVTCLVMALGPEAGWDPLYYHLRLPKLYAMRHKIYFVSYIYPSHYPQGVEMLFTYAWLVGGEGTAKLLNFAFWPLCGAALVRLAGSLGSTCSLRAVALALTLPLVGTLAAESYIDLGLTFFTLLALQVAWRGRLIAAGVFLGLAMGSKYTGILAALALGCAWFAQGGGSRLGQIVKMAAVSALLMLPWLAKNGLFTGDPVAPFFYHALGALHWAGGISQQGMTAVIPELLPQTISERGSALVLGLWQFLTHSRFAVFSPFVIGLLPFLVWRSATGLERFLKWYVATFTVLVLLLCPDGRYWQPAVFPLCVLVALGWSRLEGGRGLLRPAWSVLAVASVACGVLYHLLDMRRTLPMVGSVALGLESRARYDQRMLWPYGYADALKYLHRMVPTTGRVAVISEVQAYRIDREAIFDCDAPAARRWIALLVKRSADGNALARQFKQWNVRYVLYVRPRAEALVRREEWTRAHVRRWTQFWDARARLVFRSGDSLVYALGPAVQPAGPRLDLPGPQEWVLANARRESDPAARQKWYAQARAAGIESTYLQEVFRAWASKAAGAEKR